MDGAANERTEQITVVYEDERVRVERIVSNGCASDENFWYDQSDKEYAFVTRGEAEIEFVSGQTIVLTAGRHIELPPRLKHRVKKTSGDCEWVCVFIKSRENE